MNLRSFVWRHPHWWAVAASVLAWAWLLIGPRSLHHGHGRSILDWLLMVAAMMLPLVFEHLRLTAARSLWRRRQRAMLGFLVGYAAIAGVAGLAVLLVVAGVVTHTGASPPTVAAMFTLAALWQLSPLKRRALIACHRTRPLAPCGWRADRDCLAYGLTTGASCFLSCAAVMIACTVAGHTLTAMLVGTALATYERVNPRVDRRLAACALGAVAAWQLVPIA